MPSACAPILPSRGCCWPNATRRKAIRPRLSATTRNICRCCRTRQTPRRSARRSTNSPRSNPDASPLSQRSKLHMECGSLLPLSRACERAAKRSRRGLPRQPRLIVRSGTAIGVSRATDGALKCAATTTKSKAIEKSPPRKTIQKPHRALVIHKFLFFATKFRPMRFPPAPGKFHRMLHVQHLVIHHVSHHKFRHALAIQLPVDHNLLQRRIKTSQQAAPHPPAPTQPRLRERASEIPRVQPLK